jgi:hypothetical protein
MSKQDEQDQRIEAILGGNLEMRFKAALGVFCEHLKAHLQLPCEVTGIEDFQWEERYVIGGRPLKEYERLKKTHPSYRDRYQLLGIEQDASSDWMLSDDDIAAHVRRISDGQEFDLGLAELKATDRESPNYQLLYDYAVWFANNR